MTRINLCKYGFVRWPEEDFTDDGNRFTCYRAGKKVRVSKLISNGEVYLSADSCVGNNTLPYDVYSKLPHYNDAEWKYNGVQQASLTDKDLEDFYNACIAFEQEYEEAEANIQYPSLEDLRQQCELIKVKTMKEMQELEKLFGEHAVEAAVKFSEWEWKEVKRYLTEMLKKLNRFNPDKYPEHIYKTSYSFDFMKPTYGELAKPTFYYEQIKETFKKYLII